MIKLLIIFKNIMQNLFSVKNSEDKSHKIITILGVRFKFNTGMLIKNISDESPIDGSNECPVHLEYVPCDFCGSYESKIRYTLNTYKDFEFRVVKCSNCGLVFVNPRPTIDSMGYFYPSNYHSSQREIKQKNDNYNKYASFLPELTNEKLLDIGCAEGDFLKEMHKKFPNVECYGTDYYFNSKMPDYINFQNKDLCECGFKNEQFDIITAWAVFEHLHEPSKYFKEVSRILKEKGKFVFLVTNSESLYGVLADKESIPKHTYHFSEKILKLYAQKYNFKMNKCSYYNGVFDGTGKGAIKWGLVKLFVRPKNFREKYQIPSKFFKKLIYKSCIKLGNILDNIVFYFDWEAKLRCSGIIVVEFEKKSSKIDETKQLWEKSFQQNLENFKKTSIVNELNKNSICIDAGANIGSITEVFANKGATVYSFEPHPMAYAKLKEKFASNPKVNAINKAVLDKDSSMRLYFHEYHDKDDVFFSQGASLFEGKNDIKKNDFVDVEVIDLIEFIKNLGQNIDVLKIDIEGGEYDVLLKLINNDLHKIIKHILVEVHDKRIPEIIEKGQLVRKLINEKNIENINLDWV